MDPLRAVRADVGLRGGVRHRVIANPGCQVDVESIWVNDSIRIHQTLFSQLQNGKRLEAFQSKFCFQRSCHNAFNKWSGDAAHIGG